MKTSGVVLLAVCFSVLCITLAFAAGTSTGSTDIRSTTTNSTNATNTSNVSTTTNSSINTTATIVNNSRPTVRSNLTRPLVRNVTLNRSNANCESVATQLDRIRCRLQNRNITHLNVTEESCRNLTNPANCQTLYNRVAACYDRTGVQKDQCFKRIAGFTRARTMEEARANNHQAIRSYMVFLLYDLQERIEERHTAGELTDDEAASLIDQIVTIKKSLMENKPRADIAPLFEAFKQDYREAVQ